MFATPVEQARRRVKTAVLSELTADRLLQENPRDAWQKELLKIAETELDIALSEYAFTVETGKAA